MLKSSVAYSQFFIKRKIVLLMERSFGYILNSEIVDKTQMSRPLIIPLVLLLWSNILKWTN